VPFLPHNQQHESTERRFNLLYISCCCCLDLTRHSSGAERVERHFSHPYFRRMFFSYCLSLIALLISLTVSSTIFVVLFPGIPFFRNS